MNYEIKNTRVEKCLGCNRSFNVRVGKEFRLCPDCTVSDRELKTDYTLKSRVEIAVKSLRLFSWLTLAFGFIGIVIQFASMGGSGKGMPVAELLASFYCLVWGSVGWVCFYSLSVALELLGRIGQRGE